MLIQMILGVSDKLFDVLNVTGDSANFFVDTTESCREIVLMLVHGLLQVLVRDKYSENNTNLLGFVSLKMSLRFRVAKNVVVNAHRAREKGSLKSSPRRPPAHTAHNQSSNYCNSGWASRFLLIFVAVDDADSKGSIRSAIIEKNGISGAQPLRHTNGRRLT
jgi:hypothetical protein